MRVRVSRDVGASTEARSALSALLLTLEERRKRITADGYFYETNSELKNQILVLPIQLTNPCHLPEILHTLFEHKMFLVAVKHRAQCASYTP